MIRSQKHLAITLSYLKTFSNPKAKYEQYSTDSEIAAKLLWMAYMEGNIKEKRIIDLGCGTGILAVGALLLGAKHVVCVDVDPDIYPLLKANMDEVEAPASRWMFANQNMANCNCYDADTVIMNPPFGTKIPHADKMFLTTALNSAPQIYTLHKTSTEDFVRAFCRDNKLIIEWVEQHSYPLKNTLPKHKKKIERISVSAFHLSRQD